ncbi:hypothetical protein F2Q69_00056672 [Brassica cretica]|uniref:Uncharacterized protein n=1 Tax=Brassica cretica TaxID=69181 RepID=A0A8S9N9Y5_BRACR|nr:hypothetical protein F2Q69_00056672 [Brassica cretica]
MKLRQHARLAVMKVEEEEARSDCSCEFAFDSLRNQHKRQKWIHHHQSICILFQKATEATRQGSPSPTLQLQWQVYWGRDEKVGGQEETKTASMSEAAEDVKNWKR